MEHRQVYVRQVLVTQGYHRRSLSFSTALQHQKGNVQYSSLLQTVNTCTDLKPNANYFCKDFPYSTGKEKSHEPKGGKWTSLYFNLLFFMFLVLFFMLRPYLSLTTMQHDVVFQKVPLIEDKMCCGFKAVTSPYRLQFLATDLWGAGPGVGGEGGRLQQSDIKASLQP